MRSLMVEYGMRSLKSGVDGVLYGETWRKGSSLRIRLKNGGDGGMKVVA